MTPPLPPAPKESEVKTVFSIKSYQLTLSESTVSERSALEITSNPSPRYFSDKIRVKATIIEPATNAFKYAL